jgi:hypothetical protein
MLPLTARVLGGNLAASNAANILLERYQLLFNHWHDRHTDLAFAALGAST